MTVRKMNLAPSLFDALVDEGWEGWELVKRTGKSVLVSVDDDGFDAMSSMIDDIAESDPEDYGRGVKRAASKWMDDTWGPLDATKGVAKATTKVEQVGPNPWDEAFKKADERIRARSPIPAAATDPAPTPTGEMTVAKQPKKVMLSKALFEELKSQGFKVTSSEVVSQNARTVSLELDDAKHSRLWELTDDIKNGDNAKLKNVSSSAASRSAEAWQNKNKADRPAGVVDQQRANAEAAVTRSKAARATPEVVRPQTRPKVDLDTVDRSVNRPSSDDAFLKSLEDELFGDAPTVGDETPAKQPKTPAVTTPAATPTPASGGSLLKFTNAAGQSILVEGAENGIAIANQATGEVLDGLTARQAQNILYRTYQVPGASGKKIGAQLQTLTAGTPVTPTSVTPRQRTPKPAAAAATADSLADEARLFGDAPTVGETTGKPSETPKGASGPARGSQQVSDAIDAEIEFQRRTSGRNAGLGKSGITENIGEYRDLIDELEQDQKVIGSDADIEAGKARVVASSGERVSDRVDESYSRLDEVKAEQRAKRAAARGLGNVDEIAQAEAEAESLRAARARLTPSVDMVDEAIAEETVNTVRQFDDRRRALDAMVAQGKMTADDAARLLQTEFDTLSPAAKEMTVRAAQNAVATRASQAADVVLAANMKADPRYVSPVAMSGEHMRDVSRMSNQNYGSLRKQLTGLGMSADDISGLSPAARNGLLGQLMPPAPGATGYPTPFGAPRVGPPASDPSHLWSRTGMPLRPPSRLSTGYPTPFGAPRTQAAPVVASQATQNAARAAAQATGGGGFGPPTGFGLPTGPATPGGVPGGGGGMGGPPTGPGVSGLPIPGGSGGGVPGAAGRFDNLLFKAGGPKAMAKTAFSRLPAAGGWGMAAQLGGSVSKSLWDDPESQADDALSSALTWGGTGAALGSMILPGLGTAIGGVGGLVTGGIKGFLDGDGTSQEDILNASAEQRAKLDAAFDRLGVSAQARQDLYDRIEVQVALGAKSADEVKAIYAQEAKLAPDLIAQSRRQAKLAALQAAILPMMQQNRDMAMQRNQAAQGWLNQAASTQTDPTVASLLRAQGETLMGNAANFANASYGQALAMPTLMDLYGTAGPPPTNSSTGLTDYQSLLAQLQPAG